MLHSYPVVLLHKWETWRPRGLMSPFDIATLSPGCSLLHQERIPSVDPSGPLHLWMLSLNALDFWQTDWLAEGGRVDLWS